MIAASIFLFWQIRLIKIKIKQDPKIELPLVAGAEFESIFADLNNQNGIYFPIFRILKKILLSFILVFFYWNYLVQIILRIILSISCLIYFKHSQPFKYNLVNSIYEYTELSIVLLHGLLILYYQATPNDSNNIALILGVVCILLLIFIIVINSILMIGSIIYRIYLILLKKCGKKKIEKNENDDANTSRAKLLINNDKENSIELTKMNNVFLEKKMVDKEAECHFLEEELKISKNNYESLERESNQRTKNKIMKNKTITSNVFKISYFETADVSIYNTTDGALDRSISKKPRSKFKKVEKWDWYFKEINEEDRDSEIKYHNEFKNFSKK